MYYIHPVFIHIQFLHKLPKNPQPKFYYYCYDTV